MARSDVLLLWLLLASCAPLPAPTPATPAIAPRPQDYTCAFSRRLKAEYDALTPEAALRVFVNDAIALRDRNRAERGEPDPAPSPAQGERR